MTPPRTTSYPSAMDRATRPPPPHRHGTHPCEGGRAYPIDPNEPHEQDPPSHPASQHASSHVVAWRPTEGQTTTGMAGIERRHRRAVERIRIACRERMEPSMGRSGPIRRGATV